MPDSNLADNDVLTSTFYNTYLREQVVTTCTSGTRPTGVEGRVIFETDTDRLNVYDGAAWIPVSSAWASYTPTLTNASNGNGTLEFRYRYTGWKTVHVRGKWTLGSTSSVSGLVTFGLPDSVTADASPRSLGVAWLLDDSSASDVAGTCWADSGIKVYSTAVAPTSASVPFTWTTSDSISVDITFEIT